MIKRLTSLMLVLIMLTTLAACRGNGGDADPSSSGSAAATGPSSSAAAENLTGFVYVPEYFNLPQLISYINGIEAVDGRLYVMADYQDAASGQNGTRLYSMNPDGSDLEPIDMALDGETSVNSFAMLPDGGFWAVLYTYHYYEDSDYTASPEDIEPLDTEDEDAGGDIEPDAVGAAIEYQMENLSSVVVSRSESSSGDSGSYGESEYSLVKYDAAGEAVLSVGLSDYMTSDYFYLNYMLSDGSGNLYMCLENELVVFDKDGGELCRISFDDWIYSMARTREGDVVVVTYGMTSGGFGLKKVDLTAKSFGSAINIPLSSYNYTVFSSTDYSLFINDYTNLYGFDMDAGEVTEILNWIDSDINSNELSELVCISDTQFAATCWDSVTSTNQLVVMTKTPAADVPQKTVLNYYTLYLDYYIRSAIIQFNKTNPTYRIKVTEYYSMSGDESDAQEALNRLNADLSMGKIPDLLSLSELPIDNYINKGMLVDYYTLIDADPELSREDFLPGVLSALQTGDKLYMISPSIYIVTLVGRSDMVGGEMGWTVDEMMQAYSQLPEGAQLMRYVDKESMLLYGMYFGLDQFVDSETGKCNFEDPAFIKILQLANTMPAEVSYDFTSMNDYVDDYTLINEGTLLVSLGTVYAFDSLKEYKARFGPGNYTFIGMPTEGGNGSLLYPMSQMSITANSANKDGAWEFIKYFLSEEYQNSLQWQLPIRQSVFDKLAEEAMRPETYIDENGEEQTVESSYYVNGVEVKMEPLEQADVDYLLELINSLESTLTIDISMWEIVSEEAGPFFAGEKTAEEAARLIQNRVQIYLSENR